MNNYVYILYFFLAKGAIAKVKRFYIFYIFSAKLMRVCLSFNIFFLNRYKRYKKNNKCYSSGKLER